MMARKRYNTLPALIDFASRVRFEDLSLEVVHEAKRRIIDALACACGALDDSRVVRLLREFRRDAVYYSDPGLVLGIREGLPLHTAAFLNTLMIRWLDWNDTYLAKEPAHPSDNLGLLFALAGACKASGKDLITAAVIAYDVQCRLCEAASLRARGWDHVNYILIAAALAGARMLKMSREQMYDAVAFALSSHIALRQAREGHSLSEQKNMAAADAAEGVARALRKVRAGLHGPAEIFEGKCGFLRQVSGPLDLAAFEGLGEYFLLPETYLKKYPVEYHAQTAVSQALIFREVVPNLRTEDVERVLIDTYEAAVTIIGGKEKRRPYTKETADHSLFFVFAATLCEGRMTLAQYRDELYQDPRILALIDATEIREKPAYTRMYQMPRAQRSFPSCITLFLKSGSSVTIPLDYPVGHPRNPMSDGEVCGKFTNLAGGKLANAQKTLDDLWRLEALPHILFLQGSCAQNGSEAAP